MRARLLHIVTLASMVICAASLALVGRSFFRADEAHVPIGLHNKLGVATVDGKLTLWHGKYSSEWSYSSGSVAIARRAYDNWSQTASGVPSVGIGWQAPSGRQYLVLPLWLLPLLSAILPLRWWRRRRSHTRGFPVVDAPVEQT
jgi:hypothetical protein